MAVALIDVSSRTQKVRSRVTISGDFHTSYTYLATLLSTGISISDDSDRENVGSDHPLKDFLISQLVALVVGGTKNLSHSHCTFTCQTPECV